MKVNKKRSIWPLIMIVVLLLLVLVFVLTKCSGNQVEVPAAPAAEEPAAQVAEVQDPTVEPTEAAPPVEPTQVVQAVEPTPVPEPTATTDPIQQILNPFSGEHRYWLEALENGCTIYEYGSYPKHDVYEVAFKDKYETLVFGPTEYSLVEASQPYRYKGLNNYDQPLVVTFHEDYFTLENWDLESQVDTQAACMMFTFYLDDEDAE